MDGNGRNETATTGELLLLDADAVAARLSLSAWGVRHLHRRGRLRGVVVGHKLRWKASDVLAFVDGLGEK